MADSGKNNKIRTTSVVWGLIYSLNLSIITLIVYIADLDLPDKALFLLLAILRYSSIFVCVCSLYLLIAGFRRMIQRPGVVSALKIVLFLCSMLFGSGIIVFSVFIVTFAGGN